MKNFNKIVILISLMASISLAVSTAKEGGAKASTSESKSFSHVMHESVIAGGAK